MQVEAAAALAPVLGRFAIVVDGPLEAEVVTRLVAGGERMTTLADLARPFPGRADLSRPEAVAVARAVIARLMASGAVEAIAGGYRIADPGLAATLQRVVDAVAAVGCLPTSPVPAPAGQWPVAVPVTVEDASRVLQQTLAARSFAAGLPVTASVATSAPVVAPGMWAELVAAGWTLGAAAGGSGGGAGSGVATAGITLHPPASVGDGSPVRLVVGDADAPVARVAARLAEARPVVLSHVPAPPVTWGQGDPEVAHTLAAGLRAMAAAPGHAPTPAPLNAPPNAPLVVDRGTVPGLAVLAREDGLPSLVIVDLRSAPTAPTRTAPTTSPPLAQGP